MARDWEEKDNRSIIRKMTRDWTEEHDLPEKAVASVNSFRPSGIEIKEIK